MRISVLNKKFDYRHHVKTLEKFVVLAAWIAIYIGFYMVTKDPTRVPPMKAHSVDRVGLLPPYESEPNVNSNDPKGESNVR